LAQYFKYSELSEAHRISYASWEKFYSNVKLQISRCRDYRDDLAEFLNSVVDEYLRLKEISPAVPLSITRNVSRMTRRAPKTMKLPFILGGLQHVSAYHADRYGRDLLDEPDVLEDEPDVLEDKSLSSIRIVTV
jgi:hypothetical protein